MPLEGYELKVIEERENPLIGRKELLIEIRHIGRGTPPRYEIRKWIAEMYKKPLDVVYVRSLRTEFGLGRTIGEIHIYYDPKRAIEIEPEYIRIRNLPPEERKKALEERRG